jgi:hypothetical protein
MPEGVQLKSGVGVLGPGLDIRCEGAYVVAAPSKHHSGLLYQWLKKDLPLADVPDWLRTALIKPKLALDSKRLAPENATPEESAFAEGGRNARLTSLAGKLRAKDFAVEEMEALLLAANQKRCKPPLPESEVRGIARSMGRYAPQQAVAEAAKPARNWPSPLGKAAYHGIAGEFVRLVGPQTEADPAALLFQLLVALGSIIGRGPHFRVESASHFTNIFVALVADSSKGRKGTSWGQVHAFCKLVDIEWWSTRISGGLSTGEGLIHAVRDPITEEVPIKERGRVVDSQKQVTDAGVTDKRLLCVEGELGQALQCASRDGSILSTMLRNAWDSGTLRVMTRTSRAVCAERISRSSAI